MAEDAKFGAASNLGFVVCVVYGILYALGHWTAAAVAGLAIMLAIVASENRTANAKIIDLSSLGFFVLALITVLTVGEQVFNRYHIILAWSVFAVVTWTTIPSAFRSRSGTRGKRRRGRYGASRCFIGFISGLPQSGGSSLRSTRPWRWSRSEEAMSGCCR